MKKIYLSIAMLAVSVSLFAQAPTARRELFSTKKINTVAEAPNQNKALGVELWANDFSDPTDWTISAPNPQGEWEIGTSVPAQLDLYMAGIVSATSANGYAFFNGIQYLIAGNVAAQNATIECNTVIDVSAYSGVVLEFTQAYRAFNSDLTMVEFSTDGINWAGVEVNVDAEFGVSMTNTIRVDASSFIGGSATAQVRFRWEELGADPLYGSGFGWQIDDVSLSSKPDFDLQVNDFDFESNGLKYYQIPNTQVAPIDFWTMVSNEGDQTLTNVTLNVDVNSGSFAASSAPVSIAPTASDSVGVSTQFTPSGNGTYVFTTNLSLTEVDDILGNNGIAQDSIVVNDYIYARDIDGTPGARGGEDGNITGDYAFEAGSYFDAFASEPVYGIDVTIGSGTPDATIIYGKLYVFDPAEGDFVYVDETAEYSVTSADASSNANITLPLFTYPNLTAGQTYLVLVGCYSEFYYGTSGFSRDYTSFLFYGGYDGTGSRYYTNSTPMVRMNFDPSLAIAEVSETGAILGQNMPNPFDNNSTINFELTNTSDVQFEFVDLTGKIVKTMDLGTLANGPHSIQVDATEFASGVYYYSLVSEGSRITSKMVVQK